jgi:hypothetical protein
MMCVRSNQSDILPSGHAMMMSCPTPEHIRNKPDVEYPHQAPAGISAAILMKLFSISATLPINGGEITPVQALQLIRIHERYRQVTPADYEFLTNDLKGKSRCYGYVTIAFPP